LEVSMSHEPWNPSGGPWSRRAFLGTAGAGLAAVSMPAFVAGCARDRAVSPAAAVDAAVPANPFQTWFGVDEAAIRQVMAELTARGADFADLYFQHARNNYLALEDGIVSQAGSSIEQGLGLRVVVGDQVGYAFTEDLTLPSMLGAARTAAAIADAAAAVPPQAFTYGEIGGRYRIAVPWAEVGADRKLPLLTRTEALVRGKDPAIDKVSVTWVDYEERVVVASLDGTVVVDSRPMTRMFVNVTARRGDQVQSNGANVAARQGIDWYDEPRLELVAGQAVDRTMVLFDAVRPAAGEMPVVLAAGASGILLHEAIGHGMEADFNRKGVSIYADMIGKEVAPDFVTIVDDGTQEHQRGALNVDDEGNPAMRTALVEGGVLRTFLHDRISARHYGVAATGSGRRESFRHTIQPRMRSTYMENGPHTRDEIIASVQNGILAETYTNGQVQIGAGDYTFYVKNGWLIENGKLTAPIKDVNIIGNGPETLKRVTMVANDLALDTGGWTCGKNGQSVPVSQGMPTVLVSKMTVGGSDA
jgi:TldD protein